MAELGRTYAFAPRDRGGWVLGLSGPQCLLLGAGAIGAGALLHSGVPALALPTLVAALVTAFASVGGEPVWRLVAVAASYHRSRRRPAVAPGLERCTLDQVPVSWTGGTVAVVADATTGRATAALRAAGSGFLLAERADQERLLAAWGEALAACCVAGSPVVQVLVSAWSGPGQEPVAAPDWPEDYRAAVETSAELLGSSEVVVAVTAAARRRDGGGAQPLVIEQLRLLALRLEAAGLIVSPLDKPALLDLIERRLDSCRGPSGPLAPPSSFIDCRWRSVIVGSTSHTAWWVAEWPRLAVGPAWLEPLVLAASGVRGVAVVVEPVPPAEARRRIDRDAVRLAADEEQRSRSGFRVGARHRRLAEAVGEREGELVAGHAEVAFCGVVTASAEADELERVCGEIEQAAARCGLELGRLDGRHHLALGVTLPLGLRLGSTGLW